ncbi:MAG: anaerobic ribonucleoside-triphosphate reductase activating protein [Candidatus Pacearchaeota archaeon]
MIIVAREESMIDYPGKFGQILFVRGCNFRCSYCHNYKLFKNNLAPIDLEKLLSEIKFYYNKKWYESVCISGGEPTIYSDLDVFVSNLKKIGVLIKIDTNGSNPEILKKLLESGNVDFVAMDIKTIPEKYNEVTNTLVDLKKINESINIVKKFPDYEFRTTVLPFLSNEDFETIGKWITKDSVLEKVKTFTIQEFNPENCFDKNLKKLKLKTKEELFEIGKIMEKYANKVRVLI